MSDVYLVDVIRKKFDEEKIVTIKSLYESLAENDQTKMVQYRLHHRIRGAVYNLQESKYIERIAKGVYQKC